MKLYRINRLPKPAGKVIAKKDVLAASDGQAVKNAQESDDCPICDVFGDGRKIGSIV